MMDRERWIFWFRGQAMRAMVISCSYRTTFITTLSSSKPSVCIPTFILTVASKMVDL